MSVTIVPHRPEWPTEFYAIARALRIALDDSALRIDHVGSTAVPRLAAKDRIDVQVSVAELSSVDAVRPRLKALGYEARPDITHDHVPAHVIENTGDWKKRFFTGGGEESPNKHPCASARRREPALRAPISGLPPSSFDQRGCLW